MNLECTVSLRPNLISQFRSVGVTTESSGRIPLAALGHLWLCARVELFTWFVSDTLLLVGILGLRAAVHCRFSEDATSTKSCLDFQEVQLEWLVHDPFLVLCHAKLNVCMHDH